MISDLLPHLGELADDMCFIHSMTAKSNTHGPAENQMSTGFTLDGFPSMGAWVSYALGSEADDLPAFVAIPDPRGVPQTGRTTGRSGFLPAVFQGTAFNADKPIPNLAPPARHRAGARRRDARLPASCSTTSTSSATPATASWPRASPATSWPRGCSSAPPEVGRPVRRSRRDARAMYGADDAEQDQGRLRPQLPARPPAARARRALRAALQRRLRDGRRRRQLGRPQDAQGAVRHPRPDPRPARRGAAHAT